ncbi:hypothetical protein LO772_07035 [Yinghuangia sp. ASG 101]|uniref:hypothetical protein n=1 Tax=Yinghuangia sp. ASG 101 TaxID=2896848 RepID=UPI001E382194|nr:hypothetical protein [Yinghuangia sp. ASG 101]UGQ13356.1 hypothetical protein LO772_07035 [Yinghuangia sp. ASG 101]
MYDLYCLYFEARDHDDATDRSTRRGMRVLGRGVELNYSVEYVDITADAVTLLTEADRFIPDDVRDARLCRALVETV